MSKGVAIRIDRGKITWRKIANSTVILNKDNRRRYILNDTAVTVWNYITEGGSVGDAVDRISGEFCIRKERIWADVDRFLQNLESEEIISLEIME